jgi:hypothetical protein
MSPRHALVLVTALCATRWVPAAVPLDCEAVVNSASPSTRASGETTRRCFEALRADGAAARAAEPAPAAAPRRQFAVLRELGEVQIRQDAATATLLGAPAEPAPTPEPCALSKPGAAAVPSSECLRCHPRRGHAVDVDYAYAYGRSSWGLRSEEEVVRRGVLLPQGRLECVTCHDGRSAWKYRLALPAGAPAIPAVIAGRPETYGNGATWRTAGASSLPVLPPGTQVSPAPLCAACHTHAD